MIEAEFEEIEDGATGGEELDLSEEDSLPWLEADEEDDSSGGIHLAQVIGFALILLAILACVIGAIWYYSNRSGDSDLVADGSTIAAPEGSIKERPEDPGGKEFAGTGNVAPVVGEGGTRDGVMATDGSDAGEGSGASTDDGATTGDTSTSSAPSSTTSDTSGISVQLAAYRSRSRAEQGWKDLVKRTDALAGVRYRIEEGTVDIGTVYRLKAVADNRTAADKLCTALKADGLDCQVKP